MVSFLFRIDKKRKRKKKEKKVKKRKAHFLFFNKGVFQQKSLRTKAFLKKGKKEKKVKRRQK